MFWLFFFLCPAIFSENEDAQPDSDLSPSSFLNLRANLRSRENEEKVDYEMMLYFHNAIYSLFQKSKTNEDCAIKHYVLLYAVNSLKNINSTWNKESLLLGKIKLGDEGAMLADEIITGNPFCQDEFELFAREVGKIKKKEAMSILNDYAAIFAAKCDDEKLKFILEQGKIGIFCLSNYMII